MASSGVVQPWSSKMWLALDSVSIRFLVFQNPTEHLFNDFLRSLSTGSPKRPMSYQILLSLGLWVGACGNKKGGKKKDCFCNLWPNIADDDLVPSDHLLLDSAPNLGPLISCWEINKLENCWYKSVRILEVLKLLFQQFLNLSSS